MKHAAPAVLAVLALAASLAAASTPGYERSPTHLPLWVPGSSYVLALPPGWLVLRGEQWLVASHDGPLLETLVVRLLPPEEAARRLGRPWRTDDDAQDLAEAWAGQLRGGDREHDEVTVDRVEPATVAGQAGFRLHVLYRAPAALNSAQPLMEEEFLGAATRDGLLVARLSAVRMYYFDRWREAFEASVASLARR
jgi:hypothetical protein